MGASSTNYFPHYPFLFPLSQYPSLANTSFEISILGLAKMMDSADERSMTIE